jgi:hypothetical protein
VNIPLTEVSVQIEPLHNLLIEGIQSSIASREVLVKFAGCWKRLDSIF